MKKEAYEIMRPKKKQKPKKKCTTVIRVYLHVCEMMMIADTCLKEETNRQKGFRKRTVKKNAVQAALVAMVYNDHAMLDDNIESSDC